MYVYIYIYVYTYKSSIYIEETRSMVLNFGNILLV